MWLLLAPKTQVGDTMEATEPASYVTLHRAVGDVTESTGALNAMGDVADALAINIRSMLQTSGLAVIVQPLAVLIFAWGKATHSISSD